MKNFYKNSLALGILLLCGAIGHAQTSISGNVTDAISGDPLAGVNIVVKGRVIGTITGTDGAYSLTVAVT